MKIKKFVVGSYLKRLSNPILFQCGRIKNTYISHGRYILAKKENSAMMLPGWWKKHNNWLTLAKAFHNTKPQSSSVTIYCSPLMTSTCFTVVQNLQFIIVLPEKF